MVHEFDLRLRTVRHVLGGARVIQYKHPEEQHVRTVDVHRVLRC